MHWLSFLGCFRTSLDCSWALPELSCYLLEPLGPPWRPLGARRPPQISAPECTRVHWGRATSDTADFSGRRDKYSDNPLIQGWPGIFSLRKCKVEITRRAFSCCFSYNAQRVIRKQGKLRSEPKPTYSEFEVSFSLLVRISTWIQGLSP